MSSTSLCTVLIAVAVGAPRGCLPQSQQQGTSSAQPRISQAQTAPSTSMSARPATPLSVREESQRFLQMPLDFEANHGQAPNEFKFVAHGPNYALGISAAGMALTTHRQKPVAAPAQNPTPWETADASDLELLLAGADSKSEISGLDAQPGRSNYFIGNDPAKWHTNVPHFSRVRVAAVYPGIDLVFYGNRQQLEYDFAVAPGADPDRIRLEARGAQSVRIDGDGNALLHTEAGDVELKRPEAYQEVAGVRQAVKSAYRLIKGHELAFEVGAYDRSRALTIDPVLEYGVSLGGSNTNWGVGVAVDASGNAYVTGATCANDFPVTAGNFQQPPPMTGTTVYVFCNATFVTKIDPTGSTLLYSDFISGTNGTGGAFKVAIDGSGDAYLGGITTASDFPAVSNIGVSGPVSCGLASKGMLCPVGYVLKLNPDGSQILFSSLLGGSQTAGVDQIKLNPVSGDLVVLGGTNSSNFVPAMTTLETSFGAGSCSESGSPCYNAFLVALDPSTGALRYGTYIGGTQNDLASGLAFDSSGNIIVAGSTQPPLSSALGTVTQTYAPAGGATAAGAALFVAKLNLSGTTLTPGYLTIIEGDADTGPAEIAVDSSNNVYFTGATSAQHLPVTTGAYQTTNETTDVNNCYWGTPLTLFLPAACGTAIVGGVNSTGALSFLTYLGGSAQDIGEAIGIDSNNNLWIGGVTSSNNFPFAATHYFSGGVGYLTPFLAEMSNNGQQLLDATPVAGPNGQVSDIQIDSENNVYLAGFTAAEAPSTPGTYPPNPTVFNPAFVQKWSAGTPPSITVSPGGLTFETIPVGSASTPQTITIQNTGTTAVQLGIQLSQGYSETSVSDFLETTTCGTSLAASSSCTITATFVPGPVPATCVLPLCDPTSRGAELVISNNAIQGEQQIDLTGTAGIGPSLDVSPNPIVFPTQAAGTSGTQLVPLVANAGDSELLLSTISLTGPNASDFQLAFTGIGGPSCFAGLSPGTLCDMGITFSPAASATGTRTATLVFTDNAADNPQTVSVTGTVSGAYALNLSPLTLTPTEPVAIGTSTYTYLELQNPSANGVQITSLTVAGANEADFTAVPASCLVNGSPTLPITVPSGSTCDVSVTFDPQPGDSGTRTATLTVGTSPSISGLPTITLTGDAVTNSQPGMSFFEIPNPLNFGGLQVGETSNNESVLFTIYNNIPIPCAGGAASCGAPLVISSITPGLSDYQIAASQNETSCVAYPATIPAGSECDYAVIFTPSQAGLRNTTLTIVSNDPQGTVQLPVYGSGLSVPLGEFLETALNFGNSAIGVASPPMTATLENTGQSPLTVSTVAASTNFNVSASTCIGTIQPQATCTISVTFDPPAAEFYTATLTITDNDPIGTQQVVNLTGTGATGPQLRVTPQTLTFGNQTLDSTSPAQTVTFTSTGDSAVTFPADPMVTTQDFLESTTCSGSLAVGESCTASVQFNPTIAALAGFFEYGSMYVTDNATGSPQPIYMQGTGETGTRVSTTALASSLNPATSGQSVTFTATVTGPSGAPVPTGQVSFLDGNTLLGNAALNGSGVATLSTSTLSVGSQSITALYGGDENFANSTSTALTQVVNSNSGAAATTTMVVSSLNPSASGQSVTFTATVSGPSGNTTTPTGTVTFMDGSTILGTGSLNGSAQATYTTSSLGTGSHSITAVYGGNSTFNGSTSAVLMQVVNAPALLPTSTVVVSSLNPSAAGEAVTFTATVGGPTGNTTAPTGNVTFMDGSTTLGTESLNGSAQTTYSTSSLSAGSHSITAVYGGNSTFSGSTSAALTQVVNAPALLTSTTTVTSSLNPSGQGQSVTFTATVAGPSGNTTVPTGTVTFMDGATTLGPGSLNGSAQATYSTSSLGTGSNSITAVYGGDSNFAGSTSTVLTQMVDAASFTVSFNPTSATINPGQTATTTITVTSQYGFDQQVSFACSGLPAASECNFSPSTATPNGTTPATVTLTIDTDVAMASPAAPNLFERRGPMGKAGLLALVLLGLGGLFRSRRRWMRLFFAVALVTALGSCGGGSGGGGGGGGNVTPQGMSMVTVTVSGGNVTQNGSFTLTVE